MSSGNLSLKEKTEYVLRLAKGLTQARIGMQLFILYSKLLNKDPILVKKILLDIIDKEIEAHFYDGKTKDNSENK